MSPSNALFRLSEVPLTLFEIWKLPMLTTSPLQDWTWEMKVTMASAEPSTVNV